MAVALGYVTSLQPDHKGRALGEVRLRTGSTVGVRKRVGSPHTMALTLLF